MALAFDPNRIFFRGINKNKQMHIHLYIKKRGKGLREGSRNMKPAFSNADKYLKSIQSDECILKDFV